MDAIMTLTVRKKHVAFIIKERVDEQRIFLEDMKKKKKNGTRAELLKKVFRFIGYRLHSAELSNTIKIKIKGLSEDEKHKKKHFSKSIFSADLYNAPKNLR